MKATLVHNSITISPVSQCCPKCQSQKQVWSCTFALNCCWYMNCCCYSGKPFLAWSLFLSQNNFATNTVTVMDWNNVASPFPHSRHIKSQEGSFSKGTRWWHGKQFFFQSNSSMRSATMEPGFPPALLWDWSGVGWGILWYFLEVGSLRRGTSRRGLPQRT